MTWHQLTRILPQTLNLLHQDFDALRQLLTCKICERLLYEPYALSCGHTYCYSCLSTWFVANHKKTCPNCRVVISQPPAPCYVIKEMTLVVTHRTELLAEGETAEEHEKWQKEEADIVNKDRENKDPHTGGLFKGCFSSRRQLQPIHDPTDGVYRCPQCNWELEEGMCLQCGIHLDQNVYEDSYDSDSDDFGLASEDDGEDLDEDVNAEDVDLEHEHGMAIMAGLGGHDPAYGDSDYGSSTSGAPHNAPGDLANAPGWAWGDDLDEDDEEEMDEEDDDLDGFVVDDAEEHYLESSSINSDAAPIPPRGYFARPHVISDDEEDSEEDTRQAAVVIEGTDYSSDSESAPEVLSSRRRVLTSHRAPFARPRARARPIAISSSDESENEDVVPAPQVNAFSPQINGYSSPEESSDSEGVDVPLSMRSSAEESSDEGENSEMESSVEASDDEGSDTAREDTASP